MGIASVRSAFLAAANGRLRIDHAGLSYQNSHQVLSFTGWHADGAPFAMVTAPFDDDPVLRAAQVARDIIAAYVGRPAAAPINELRSKIAMSQKRSRPPDGRPSVTRCRCRRVGEPARGRDGESVRRDGDHHPDRRQRRVVCDRPARRERALLERRAEPYARLVRIVARVRRSGPAN